MLVVAMERAIIRTIFAQSPVFHTAAMDTFAMIFNLGTFNASCSCNYRKQTFLVSGNDLIKTKTVHP